MAWWQEDPIPGRPGGESEEEDTAWYEDVWNFLVGDGTYTDSSDLYAENNNYYIYFQHIATGTVVRFKAFLTGFEDTLSSRWRDEDVYGRMDPISTFQGTRRQINFGFDVIASSVDEAIRNREESVWLTKFLYPVYERTPGESVTATSIVAPPLLKIKFVNLISTGNARTPLVGKLDGLSYRPDLEAGFFEGKDRLLPKVNKFSCNFTVFHTSPLGFTRAGDAPERTPLDPVPTTDTPTDGPPSTSDPVDDSV